MMRWWRDVRIDESPSQAPSGGRRAGGTLPLEPIADARHSSRVGTSQGGRREPISTSTDTTPNYSGQTGFRAAPVTRPGHFTRVWGEEGSCAGAR